MNANINSFEEKLADLGPNAEDISKDYFELNPKTPEVTEKFVEILRTALVGLMNKPYKHEEEKKYETKAHPVTIPKGAKVDGVDISKAGNAAVIVTENPDADEDGKTLINLNGFGIYSLMDPLHNEPGKVFQGKGNIKRIITVANPIMDGAHGWNQEEYAALCKFALEKLDISKDDLVTTSISTGFQALARLSEKDMFHKIFPFVLYNGPATSEDGNPITALKRYGFWKLMKNLASVAKSLFKNFDVPLGSELDYDGFAFNRQNNIKEKLRETLQKSVIAGEYRDKLLELIDKEFDGMIPVTSKATWKILFEQVSKKILEGNKSEGGLATIGLKDLISKPSAQEKITNILGIPFKTIDDGDHYGAAVTELIGATVNRDLD